MCHFWHELAKKTVVAFSASRRTGKATFARIKFLFVYPRPRRQLFVAACLLFNLFSFPLFWVASGGGGGGGDTFVCPKEGTGRGEEIATHKRPRNKGKEKAATPE